jgi:hypothetical protein
MGCTQTHQVRIVHLAAGEMSPLQRWRMGRHLRGCEVCQAELREVEALQEGLAAMAEAPGVPAFHAPSRDTPSVTVPPPGAGTRGIARHRRWRWVPLTVALGAAALLAVTLPFWSAPREVSANDVREALGMVDTWHGIGWKFIRGERVPWEVWGRRSPALYYVRIGDQVRVDDDRQRLEVFPPEAFPPRDRQEGLVLRTPSQGGLDDWTSRPELLFLPGQETGVRAGDEDRRTARFEVRLGDETRTFIVDKRARVPVQFEARSGVSAGPPSEMLRLSYGVRLPGRITDLTWPARYQVVDSLNPASIAGAREEYLARSGGVAGEARPLAMDREGHVLLRLRGWLGDVKLDGRAPFLMWLATHSEAFQARDEGGRIYVSARTGVEVLQHITSLDGDRLLLLAPLEPLGGSPLPGRLEFTLSLAAGLRGASHFETVSLEERLEWSLPLPRLPRGIDLDEHLDTGWRDILAQIGDEGPLLPSAVAVARANHYLGNLQYGYERGDLKTGSPELDGRLRRAAHWLEQALEVMDAHPGWLSNRSAAHQRDQAQRRLEWARKQLGDRGGQAPAPVRNRQRGSARRP